MQLQLHYITQRYTTLTTPHRATLHYTTLITLHYSYNYTTLHYTRLHYSTQHYSTLRYTTLITPHNNYKCNCTTLFTLHYNYNLQLQLHYVTLQLQLQLHYTLHPAVVARWPLQPLQPLQKTQLQPPFGPSVGSLCHLWFTTTSLSYRFPIFETFARLARYYWYTSVTTASQPSRGSQWGSQAASRLLKWTEDHWRCASTLRGICPAWTRRYLPSGFIT